MVRTKALPRMESEVDSELETAAETYVERRDKRMAALEDEIESKDELLALMRQRKRTVYKHGELTIEVIAAKDKLKVRTRKGDVEDEGGAE